ncbi:MAG: outer membrane beta-barrel protein [Bacteroidota bacterium]
MKYLLTTFTMLSLMTSLMAQAEKGTMLIGGGIGFSGLNDNVEFSAGFSPFISQEFESYSLAVRPQIGWFLNENTLLGVGLSYEYAAFEQKFTDPLFVEVQSSQTSNLVLLNPYLIKYTELTDKLYFTTTFNLLAGIGRNDFENDREIESNLFVVRLNISPGLTYFFSEKWALNAGIGQLFYNRIQETLQEDGGSGDEPRNVENTFGASFDFNTFTIGFQYFIPAGRK